MTVDTGLDISSKLGDFTQVQLGANIPVPIMNGMPGVNVTIANQDLTNTVTIARRNSFQQNASNTATVPPLGSITVDASKTIWGLAPAGTLPVLIFPGGGSWAPSPAQVAAQINALGLAKDTSVIGTTNAVNGLPTSGLSTTAQQITQNTTIPNNIATTGVPLLTKSTQLVNISNANLNSGAQSNRGPFSFNQPGYNIQFQVSENVNGTPRNSVSVEMDWSDSTTGQIVGIEQWDIMPTGAGNAKHTIDGWGPTKGDTLSIIITNNDTQQVNYNLIMVVNSRIYPRDDWRTTSWDTFFSETRFNSQMNAYDLGEILTSATGAGASLDRVLPLYCGRARVHFDTTSLANDMELIIRVMNNAWQQAGQTNIIYDRQTDSTGNQNDYFTFPRSQTIATMSNKAAAAKNLRAVFTFEDY